MNGIEFNKLLDELDGNSLETLKQKNTKYASADDCLHNFESGAEIMGSTPAQCAWCYLTKHLVALRDKVERDDFSDREDFLEKCQDIINYIRFIWVIGNVTQPITGDQFCGWDDSDWMEEDSETSIVENYHCWNCANSNGEGYPDSPECITCISGRDSAGKTISPPSNFIRKDTVNREKED